jgi:hypothetical protein
MFGFKGPLWMTQTCNDDSGCPFVQVGTDFLVTMIMT